MQMEFCKNRSLIVFETLSKPELCGAGFWNKYEMTNLCAQEMKR